MKYQFIRKDESNFTYDFFSKEAVNYMDFEILVFNLTLKFT